MVQLESELLMWKNPVLPLLLAFYVVLGIFLMGQRESLQMLMWTEVVLGMVLMVQQESVQMLLWNPVNPVLPLVVFFVKLLALALLLFSPSFLSQPALLSVPLVALVKVFVWSGLLVLVVKVLILELALLLLSP